jgi:hypothetical protein
VAILLSKEGTSEARKCRDKLFGPEGKIGHNSDVLRTEWYTFYGCQTEKIFYQKWKELRRVWRVYTKTLGCVLHVTLVIGKLTVASVA